MTIEWKRVIAMPLQELCGVMSMVPKTDGDVRMVCAQGAMWRNERKVASKVRKWHLIHNVEYESLDRDVHVLGQVHLIELVQDLLEAVHEGVPAGYDDSLLGPDRIVVFKLGFVLRRVIFRRCAGSVARGLVWCCW